MRLISKDNNTGFSLIEILITVTIIVVLVISVLLLFSGQLSKSRDGRRKADIQKITTAFEEYYSDFGCYPPGTILDVCGGNELQPYMPAVLCDPQTKTKYQYAPEPVACPTYYRIFTKLERDNDPESLQLGCTPEAGCGAAEYFPELEEEADELNYGDAKGVTLYEKTGRLNTPPPTPSGSPSTGTIYRYCCPSGGDSCNSYNPNTGSCSGSSFETSPECVAFCN